ncbi:MAG: cytochrome d ubiquinol oxidase subunit II [Leptospirales bacterium]
MFDYATLKVIWWVLVLLMLTGFAVMDGFDLGIGILLLWIGRSDLERRTLLNSVGPHWEGNKVWLVVSGGAVFAAWPLVYATAFSVMYPVMILLLWSLFLRPVGFVYRSKLPGARWRKFWDWGIVVGGVVPILVSGIAFGTLFEGIAFRFDANLHSSFAGSFMDLFTPFSLAAGGISLLAILHHGASYLTLRTEGILKQRSVRAALISGGLLFFFFPLLGIALKGLDGYRIVAGADPQGMPDPLAKTVIRVPGGWFQNYEAHPVLWMVPVLVNLGIVLSLVAIRLDRPLAGFVGSSLATGSVIATAGVSLFPFILPSSLDPSSSLTVWDSVSSPLTLLLMFWATVILTPIVIFYTAWCYRVMRGTVTEEGVRKEEHSLY